MAQSLTTPISELIRAKNNDGDEPKRKTREEYKQAKELEEARKLGTVPADVDEEGKDINPHIPQYISQAPWYIGTTHATLKHQRMQPEDQKQYSKLTEWYKRGVDTTSVATKFRKGACENCGAVTHKRKDCLERPRKTLARYTGSAIAPDEHSQPTLSLDFDGKRDRWNGYDPTEYNQVVEEHRKVEEAKRQLKANKLKAGSSTAEETEHDGGGGSDSEDDEKYAEGVDMPGTKVDSKQRITVRNLRIREDTAKYLRNLALDSAYYDPKTRSMRENPYEGKGSQDVDYQGENFVRFSGDTSKVARTQLFAWDAQKSGVDVHVISDPTRLELLQRQYEQNRDKLEGTAKGSLLERYGGQEHLETLPRQLLLAQSEDYVEYSRQGKVLRGAEKEVVRSQYEEDVYVNNHSSVWGSFWRDGVWGYKCCHGSVKNSYCTGEAGREAAASDPVLALTSSSSNMPPPTAELAAAADGLSEDDEKTQLQDRQRLATMLERDARQAKKRERKRKKAEKKQKKKQKRKRKDLSSSDSGSEESEDEEEARKRKVAQAMVAQMAQEASAARLLKMDERKRPYNSMVDVSEPTPEEMEAWRMRQSRQDDPMANFTTDC